MVNLAHFVKSYNCIILNNFNTNRISTSTTDNTISTVYSGIHSNFETTNSKLSPTDQYMVTTAKYCLYPQHFDFQLTHTTLKNVELLKHFKISKTAPTCFGLQGNHHQGATIST